MFYLAQALIVLYAFCSAQQEAPIVSYQKDYVAINDERVDQFHFWGWLMTAIVGITLSLFQTNAFGYIATPLLAALWYWMVFDGTLNKLTDQPFFYVGHTSKVDKWLNKRFGKDAGKRKVQVCVAVITLINVGYIWIN